ncbi:hypothetical protein C8J57DRAFT_1558735 [Mycena rebaudengoi]|nr:hypothetical protein C8J57DRAFT_1558735 [Mycena rebaudengoi]
MVCGALKNHKSQRRAAWIWTTYKEASIQFQNCTRQNSLVLCNLKCNLNCPLEVVDALSRPAIRKTDIRFRRRVIHERHSPKLSKHTHTGHRHTTQNTAIDPTDAQADQKTAPANPMKKPKIDKLTSPDSPIEMLEELTGQTPVTSKARYAVRTIGIRRKEKIA